ncbi:MAG: divergent polysaccharide deacetylase family protein [Candidatus Cloacimonetes bacterium]|nr:divergent polysaccharide deacetylase family protein [Candidatus Cloacimonadota bacterium]
MINARRKYKRKKPKKNKKSFSFKTFLIIAVIIIVAFFVWQLVVNISQKEKKEPTFIIKEIPEEKEKIPVEIEKGAVESAINYALQRLEIPEEFIKTYSKRNKICKDIIIDINQLSLTIANIFITDKVEEVGGQVISVEESKDGNSIEMKIFDPIIKQYYILKIKNDTNNLYEKIIKLSVIIDDFGYFSGELLDEFLALDKSITFSILPELSYSQEVMQKAYNQGRETFIHIPMEPISYPQNDPGKNAIFVHLSEEEIEKRVKKYIKNLPLCIGGNNHMGSLATQHRDVMMPVLKIMKENNLIFVDSKTTPKSIANSLAKEMGIPTYQRDLFLDPDEIKQNRVEIITKKILKYSEGQNKIVAITHCNRKSLDELKQILKNVSDSSASTRFIPDTSGSRSWRIKLIPISEILMPEEYVL